MREELLSFLRVMFPKRLGPMVKILFYIYAGAAVVFVLYTFLPRNLAYIAIAGFVGMSIVSAPLFLRRSLPIAYDIAILGITKSGKTTLLTQMFNELLLFRIDGVRAQLRGEKTINRVSDYIARIKAGIPVGLTDAEKRFPYTANVQIGLGLFQREYKVTFGDYPGEQSKRVSDLSRKGSFQNNREAYRSLLRSSEFFGWVLECDSIVFIVDVARYLQEKYRSNGNTNEKEKKLGYVLEMTRSIMYDWHRIMEVMGGGPRTRQPRVALVFTKADLFDVKATDSRNETMERKITLLGFEPPLPKVKEVDKERYSKGVEECKESFADLITFLSGNAKSFEVVFTSSFGLLEGRRIGIQKVFEAAIPQ